MTSLVLPAFNPGPAAEDAWLAVEKFVRDRADRGDPWEALFVLDGCTDDTPALFARLAGARRCGVRFLGYPRNRGKGYAVRTGLLAARGTVRVFTDADLAYPFADVVRVAEAVRAGPGVVIGSRAHPDSWVSARASALGYVTRRAIQGRVFGTLARALLPITNRDTQAGLKGMTAGVAAALLPHLECDGFGFDCELLTACARSGVPVGEVPVSVRYDARTTTRIGSGVRMVRELWQIRRRWRNKTVPVPAPAPVFRAA